MREPKAGELYRYSGTSGHCRSGLVRIVETKSGLIAVDTYWNDSSVSSYKIDDVKDKLEFILDLNTARLVDRETFDVYEDVDRAYIPMGGTSEKFYVRTDATPSLQREWEKLKYEVARTKSHIKYETFRLANLEQKLVELEGRVDSRA